jgi:hypothetical protein
MYRFDVTKWAREYNWFTFENWLTKNIGPIVETKMQGGGRFKTYIGDGWILRIVYGRRPQRERWNIVEAIAKNST